MADVTSTTESGALLGGGEEGAERGLLQAEGGIAGDESVALCRLRYERAVPVAHDIIEEARAMLAVRFRFLDRALWRMPLEPYEGLYGIASDGRRLIYDPLYVVDQFKRSMNEVVRDLVHCLFHCIFRHPFMLYSVKRSPWDAACDIAIEAIALDLLGEAFPCSADRRLKEALKTVRAQFGGAVTAERLYRAFYDVESRIDFRMLAPLFHRDSHVLWYGDPENAEGTECAPSASSDGQDQISREAEPELGNQNAEAFDGDAADGRTPDEQRGSEDGAMKSASVGGGASADSPDGIEGLSFVLQDSEELAEEWERVSHQIQTELEMRVMRRGDEAGSMVASLEAVNREMRDYSAFLKRFATLHERMKVNDDEFDYIYYHYGLDRYGDMPLIEPLEYKDKRVISDFVIAIDTSGSCSGQLVQGFIRTTYNILKQVESFNKRVNIHIIQCDAAIQDDTVVTSLDQLELYIDQMELHGFGGTDFRPVFTYIDLLRSKGELDDLRGMVYFTDGEGVFPQKAPDYDVAFVFLDDGLSDPDVPPWALRLILDERQIVPDVREARDRVPFPM